MDNTHSTHAAHAHPTVGLYLMVFGALMVLTAITVAVAFVNLGPLNNVVAITIAFTKTILVVLFFMHVRYSKPLIGLVVFGAVLWLAILIGLTLADFMSRG